jgi:hypothetical protein
MIARAIIAILCGVSVAAAQTPPVAKPVVISDKGARWFETRSWGGGAAVRLDLPERREPGAPSLAFLSGAGPEMVFGCNSHDPAKSRWRFRAGFSPPGAVINNIPGAERAYTEGVARLTGTQGLLVLYDELDKPMLTLHLWPTEGALETAPLTAFQQRQFRDASAIRLANAQMVMEARMDDLALVLARLKNLPCEGA